MTSLRDIYLGKHKLNGPGLEPITDLEDSCQDIFVIFRLIGKETLAKKVFWLLWDQTEPMAQEDIFMDLGGEYYQTEISQNVKKLFMAGLIKKERNGRQVPVWIPNEVRNLITEMISTYDIKRIH